MLTKARQIPFLEIILFGFWPSVIKKALYRIRGYKIAPTAHIGLGSVIVGNAVDIGEEVKIGLFSFIVGRKVVLEPRVHIGLFNIINTYDIHIGEGTRINNQVVIGGMQTPRSQFKIGKNGIVMEWSFINTTEPVIIGDDVGIGGHCLLFTHGFWPNGFEGNPVKFGPIHIEDKTWLAWRISVLPGAHIGKGCIVSSDACVMGTLPEGALAGGVPAKVIRENYAFKKEPTLEFQTTMLKGLLNDFQEWLTFHGFGVACEGGDHPTRMRITSHKGDVFQVHVLWKEGDLPMREPRLSPHTDVVLSLPFIPTSLQSQLDQAKISWLDIAHKKRSRHTCVIADETEEFLRRRGLRLLKYT
jgi:acetyltransferase-like isoleucine patch superfamily enzyme